jgi:hypothetical protein
MEWYLDGILAKELIKEIENKVLKNCESDDVLFVHIAR